MPWQSLLVGHRDPECGNVRAIDQLRRLGLRWPFKTVWNIEFWLHCEFGIIPRGVQLDVTIQQRLGLFCRASGERIQELRSFLGLHRWFDDLTAKGVCKMSLPDEPLFVPDSNDETTEDVYDPQEVADRIRRLVEGQQFVVLSTQGEGQPYSSLVAFAMRDNMCFATFATPRATRKFRLLSECDHVSLLFDNRPDFPGELMKVEAVTATGRTALVEEGDDFEYWAALLTERHPYLNSFVRSPSCGLFKIEIMRYLHVCRFQEVRQWIPGSSG